MRTFQSPSEVAESGRENSDGGDGAEHNRDLQRMSTKAAAIEAAGERQELDEFDGRRHIARGSVGVTPVVRRDRRGLQLRSRSVLRPVGPPGGPDALNYEAGRLDGAIASGRSSSSMNANGSTRSGTGSSSTSRARSSWALTAHHSRPIAAWAQVPRR